MPKEDPLDNPDRLIRRVYSYVAYRLGHGPQAEDVTSEVFEQALRYRGSYDSSKGEPLSWLIGIARHCIAQSLAAPAWSDEDMTGTEAPDDVETAVLRRVSLRDCVAALGERDRELIALRYGADLRAREIGEVLGLNTNAVEVALHRALERLRAQL